MAVAVRVVLEDDQGVVEVGQLFAGRLARYGCGDDHAAVRSAVADAVAVPDHAFAIGGHDDAVALGVHLAGAAFEDREGADVWPVTPSISVSASKDISIFM